MRVARRNPSILPPFVSSEVEKRPRRRFSTSLETSGAGLVQPQGFTLVELMVALLIFGILSAAGVALLSSSVRSQSAAATRLDEIAVLRRVSALMAADFAGAVRRSTREQNGLRRPAFVGNAPGEGDLLIGLVRGGWSNLDAAPRPSLQKVDYRFVGDRLERIAYPQLDGAQPGPPAVILAGLQGLSVQYRSVDGWTPRWDPGAGDRMPSAVEVVLQPAGRAPIRQVFLVGAGR